MSTFSVLNPTIWVHDQDMTSYLKKATLKADAEPLDVTTFSNTSVVRIGGLKTVAMDADGFWDSTPDAAIYSSLGIADRVVTISAQGAETNVAYMFQSGRFSYEQFGQVGEAAPFAMTSMNTNGQGGLIRGLMGSAKRTISGTGNVGQAVNLGLLGSGQYLYGSFHAFSVGTTLTVRIMSGTSAGSTPNVRITLPAITVAGGYWAVRLAGPVASDTWWVYNASTVTGSFSVAGAIGIGS